MKKRATRVATTRVQSVKDEKASEQGFTGLMKKSSFPIGNSRLFIIE